MGLVPETYAAREGRERVGATGVAPSLDSASELEIRRFLGTLVRRAIVYLMEFRHTLLYFCPYLWVSALVCLCSHLRSRLALKLKQRSPNVCIAISIPTVSNESKGLHTVSSLHASAFPPPRHPRG